MPKLRVPDAHLLRLLKLVFRHRQVSRSALAEETGYSAFLVSRLSEALIRSGFVVESGSGNSTGGRRPKLLSLAPGLGRLVGIDLGTMYVRAALTDASGNVLEYEKDASHVAAGPEVALSRLMALVRRLLQRSQTPPAALWGIGAGISGVVDRADGSILLWPKVPQWVNVPVRQILADAFGCEVAIDDSARTMALAERWIGAARDVPEFIYVMLGAGTGAALYLNGALYTGSGGYAGEFGHTTIDENGPPCACGNRGCLESTASASAVIHAASQALASGAASRLWQLCAGDPKAISIELIAHAARQQDRFCLNLLNEAGNHIGSALVGLVNLLNPGLVVLGGGFASAASEFVLPQIQKLVGERALERSANQVRVQLSPLSETDWTLGSALLIADRVLESRFVASGRSPDRARQAKAAR